MANNLPYEIEIPSKVFDREWIWADTQTFEKQADTTYSGKWMIFASLDRTEPDNLTQLDHLWIKIQHQTFLKKFYKASARTSKKTDLSQKDYGVICVHTTDYRNKSEVLLTGIKIALLLNDTKTEILKPLMYKTYEETKEGPYPGPNMYRLEYSHEYIVFLEHHGCDDFEEIYEGSINVAVLNLLPKANGPSQQSEDNFATFKHLNDIMERSFNNTENNNYFQEQRLAGESLQSSESETEGYTSSAIKRLLEVAKLDLPKTKFLKE